MKRTAIILAIIILGVGALVYPTVSDYFIRKNGSEIVQDYTKKITELDDETKSTMWAEADSYNEMLNSQQEHGFFQDGAISEMSDDYRQLLNINGIMGYVDIPKLEIYLPIYHGTGDDVLNKGAGHLEGSAMPIGGSFRHSVITGHSGLVHAKMFTDLPDMIIGDMFYIHVLDEVLAYQVVKISIVTPDITDELAPFDNKDYCTLLTCTPYGVNTHRLLVRGERVEYSAEIKEAIWHNQESRADDPVMWAAIITTSVMVIIITITAIAAVRMKRKRMHNTEQKTPPTPTPPHTPTPTPPSPPTTPPPAPTPTLPTPPPTPPPTHALPPPLTPTPPPTPTPTPPSPPTTPPPAPTLTLPTPPSTPTPTSTQTLPLPSMSMSLSPPPAPTPTLPTLLLIRDDDI